MMQHQADAIAAFLKRSRECIEDAEALLRATIEPPKPQEPTTAGKHLKLVEPETGEPE